LEGRISKLEGVKGKKFKEGERRLPRREEYLVLRKGEKRE
jgi:hypothetical protein